MTYSARCPSLAIARSVTTGASTMSDNVQCRAPCLVSGDSGSMDMASGAATRVSNAMTQRRRIEVLRSFAICFRIFISSHLLVCMECRTHRRAGRHHGCFVVAAVEPFQNARSEEHTSELQSLMRISYAVFCLKTNTN